MFTLRQELKAFGVILAVAALIGVAWFGVEFAQAVVENDKFNNDCRMLSENRFTNTSSWHCIDNVTYWKRDGIIFDRIGKRGATPKY